MPEKTVGSETLLEQVDEEVTLKNPSEATKLFSLAQRDIKNGLKDPIDMEIASTTEMKKAKEMVEKINDSIEKIRKSGHGISKFQELKNCMGLFDIFQSTYKVKWKNYDDIKVIYINLLAKIEELRKGLKMD